VTGAKEQVSGPCGGLVTTIVRTRKAPEIRNDLVGIAGVHYVAFELSRRGMIALPTTRNTKGYDIIVVSSDGTRHANIQVKAAQKCPSFWPMQHFEKIRKEPNDWYVLVRGILKGAVECFLVSGQEARAQVKRVEEEDSKEGRAPFPCIYVGTKRAEAGAKERWKSAWEAWKL